ncbi:peptidoglycan DD-metalloendopeptidase family protein [Aquiflexum sp.]|uniref:peptidoglycan DD-metalloendopeptidase family protein n=1 Tax=Aquiflexum sp. TaxID=1872584 RepID=UPI0035933523
MNTRSLTLFIIFAILLLGCKGTSIKQLLGPSNPYDQYRTFLQSSEFDNAAIVREWVHAGEVALSSPIEIKIPYREISHFDKNQPKAIYMEFGTKEGQLISVQVDLISNPDSRFFIDLYEMGQSDPKNIQFAKDTNRLEFQVRNSGRLGLRIQPELFRGGLVEITIQQNPTLAFPISGKNYRSIASFFGVQRDGGRRVHEGVDVFAPRGTPVTTVSPGRVRSVGVNNLGGKTVSVSHDGYSFYYAHLDSQLVNRGQSVKVGDTLGTVGNTGNAITIAPHLHFGIYRRGAVDPYPFFETVTLTNSHSVADSIHLGQFARIRVATANLRNQPNTQSTITQNLSQNEIIRLQAKINDWFRVMLPDGTSGYIFENLLTYELSAFESLEENVGLMIRENFADSYTFDASNLSEKLEVIGKFQDSRLLRTESGRIYWAY